MDPKLNEFYATICGKNNPSFETFFLSLYSPKSGSHTNSARELYELAKATFKQSPGVDVASQFYEENHKKMLEKTTLNEMMKEGQRIFDLIRETAFNPDLVAQLMQLIEDMRVVSIRLEEATKVVKCLNEIRVFQLNHLSSLDDTITSLRKKLDTALKTSDAKNMVKISMQIEYTTQQRFQFEQDWDKMDKTNIEPSMLKKFW